MLSIPQIEAHVEAIAAQISSKNVGDLILSDCVAIGEKLGLLRAEYRAHPADFAAIIQRLSEVSRRFDEMLAARATVIVDRFHMVNEQFRRIESEKSF